MDAVASQWRSNDGKTEKFGNGEAAGPARPASGARVDLCSACRHRCELCYGASVQDRQAEQANRKVRNRLFSWMLQRRPCVLKTANLAVARRFHADYLRSRSRGKDSRMTSPSERQSWEISPPSWPRTVARVSTAPNPSPFDDGGVVAAPCSAHVRTIVSPRSAAPISIRPGLNVDRGVVVRCLSLDQRARHIRRWRHCQVAGADQRRKPPSGTLGRRRTSGPDRRP